MPKKKKGGGGKKAKDKSDKAPPPEQGGASEGAVPEVLPAGSKEFYLIQIRDLEERLGRYRKHCEQLKIENEDKSLVLTQVKEDMDIIISAKKSENDNLARKVNSGMMKIEEMDETLRKEKEEMENQTTSIRHKSQEEKEQLIQELREVQKQNEILEEFRDHKDQLEAKLQQLENKVEFQKHEFEENLSEVEKKKVINQERLKKDMVEKVKEASQEFRKASEKQMSETTKRAIRENISISSQLVRISSKNEELLAQNDSLRKRLQNESRERTALEQSFHDITRKNVSLLKMFEKLSINFNKCRARLIEVNGDKNAMEGIQAEFKEIDSLNITLSYEIQSNHALIESLKKNLQQTTYERDLAKEQNDHLLRVLSRAAKLVESSVYPSSDIAVAFSQREDFVLALLEVLETAKQYEHQINYSSLESNPPFIQPKLNSKISSTISDTREFPNYTPGSLGFLSTTTTTAKHTHFPPINAPSS